jgi:putative methyltransferase (TIGR04325 family)
MKFHIWQGVYKSFDEVPIKGKAFTSTRWTRQSLKKIKYFRSLANIKNNRHSVLKYNESLLPIISAILHHQQKQVKILDVGGSIGVSYYQVISSINAKRLEFHIVDLKSICSAGRKFFKKEKNIFFHSILPNPIIFNFDIIHLGSSIQYIENWQELLFRIQKFKPKYFLFTDLLAGNIPTFATGQYYYGSIIPAWFFNKKQIINYMKRLGFKLIFQSAYLAKILGREVKELPMNNFKKKYRLEQTCNLLFIKN